MILSTNLLMNENIYQQFEFQLGANSTTFNESWSLAFHQGINSLYYVYIYYYYGVLHYIVFIHYQLGNILGT